MRRTTVALGAAVAGMVLAGALGVSAQTISSLSIFKNAGNSPDNFQDDLVTSFQRTTTVQIVSSSFTGFQTRYAEAVGVDVGLTGEPAKAVPLCVQKAPEGGAVDLAAHGAVAVVD